MPRDGSMRKRLASSFGRALRVAAPARNLDVRPSDTFLTSYPRSGNTWVRFLIANLLHPREDIQWTDVQEVIPDIYKVARRTIDRLPDPRLLKSHEYFDPRYPRVIYVVRDPRDVAVSYFHFQAKVGLLTQDAHIATFVRLFLDGSVDGFGTWAEHVESWLSTRGDTGSFLLIRYEDLLAEPLRTLTQIAEFLHLDANEESMVMANELSTLERVKAAERAVAHEGLPASSSVTFARTGRSGSWREELPADLADAITSTFGKTMKKVHY